MVVLLDLVPVPTNRTEKISTVVRTDPDRDGGRKIIRNLFSPINSTNPASGVTIAASTTSSSLEFISSSRSEWTKC